MDIYLAKRNHVSLSDFRSRKVYCSFLQPLLRFSAGTVLAHGSTPYNKRMPQTRTYSMQIRQHKISRRQHNNWGFIAGILVQQIWVFELLHESHLSTTVSLLCESYIKRNSRRYLQYTTQSVIAQQVGIWYIRIRYLKCRKPAAICVFESLPEICW